MMNNETIIPDYNSVLYKFCPIYTNRLNSITATINNPSIIGFDNIEKSFKAISNGETFAIVSTAENPIPFISVSTVKFFLPEIPI